MTTVWRVGQWTLRASGVVVAVGLIAIAGLLVPSQPLVSAGIALGALALGLTLLDPIALPTLAIPALLVVSRVGAGGTNLAMSDFVLAAAFIPAVLLCQRPVSREFASVIGLNAVYQFATLLTVVANPYLANVVEWFHAWMLVSGALFVGWAIGRGGRGPLAMKLLIAGTIVMAVGTLATALVQYAKGDFGPVYPAWPYPMHKNFAGTVLGLAAVVVYLRPSWLGWSARLANWLLVILLAGVAVTLSRQALLGLVVVFFLVVIWPRVDRRRSRAILVVGAALLGVVGVMVQDQLQSGNRFNSTLQRVDWFQSSATVWLTDPWLGVGLRWWYTDRFEARFQPPNIELELLTSAGVVGLVAFFVMFGGTLHVLRRIDPAYGLLPSMVLICRLAQAQFDLFWAAVLGSLPWLIVGLALGALAHDQAERAENQVRDLVAPKEPGVTR